MGGCSEKLEYKYECKVFVPYKMCKCCVICLLWLLSLGLFYSTIIGYKNRKSILNVFKKNLDGFYFLDIKYDAFTGFSECDSLTSFHSNFFAFSFYYTINFPWLFFMHMPHHHHFCLGVILTYSLLIIWKLSRNRKQSNNQF